jgi:DinB superfamily
MTTDDTIKQSVWNQFGAGLDMLENAIVICPVEHWETEMKFWYIAFHCLFWTDYYLTIKPNEFNPPKEFTFSEFEQKQPDRVFSKAELLIYLQHCRQKAQTLISALTTETLATRWINDYKNFSLLEILLYNMRHIQHHTAQLNLILRQHTNNAPNWISQTTK